ncbi:MAG: DUF4956 domain-containing protein [bacterium]|nr:DUF4956 domain-containing protein [bacterium]
MFNSIISAGLTLENLAICSAVSILCGLIIAFTHTRTTNFTKNFAITLVSLPILVQAVMMMVNGNLGTGVAIMGAFGLVRFRSLPGTSREIVSVFFAMAMGLATGTGYVIFAIMATLLISLMLAILTKIPLFDSPDSRQILRITLPEDADAEQLLNPIFENFKVKSTLLSTRLKNMGSLFELTYQVDLPRGLNQKEFIDELRIRNRNLALILSKNEFEGGL